MLYLIINPDDECEGVADLDVLRDEVVPGLPVEDLHGGPGHGRGSRQRCGSQRTKRVTFGFLRKKGP